ncbi:hypothetical protein [Streptomyces sp. IMTB 2501]|uniref:hypothetical protein n=1 Tax=Streptomyces sp. IMTB 2501 TaxID=1776340 RepID=UPI002115EAFB|nr:hypothetical protein [Streptomyces sp. IMTB 2501]
MVGHAQAALQLDVVTALPTPAAHARACRAADDIVAAAAADPSVSTVRAIDSDYRELGRDRQAVFAHAAARRRPHTAQEAAASTPSSGPCTRRCHG